MAYVTILGDSIVSHLPDVIPGAVKIGYSGARGEIKPICEERKS